jgi:hypothetical protein
MVSKIKLEILKMELQLEDLIFFLIDLTLGKTNLKFKKYIFKLETKNLLGANYFRCTKILS